MSSWGEDLLRYKQEKLKTPWDVSRAPTPHARVKWSELAQKQRAFNPVLQRDVSTSAERRRAAQEAQAKQRHADRAMHNRLKTTYVHYDVLTNQTKYPTLKPEEKRPFVIADTRTDYNILNFNSHFNKDRWDQFTQSKAADRGKKVDYGAELTFAKDFDIVSTKYKADHNARVWREREAARVEKEEEFRKRNDYNPVRGVFYDKQKEKAFRRLRQKFVDQHSQKEPQLPPSLLKADGQLFNVVNHEVLDEDGVKRKEAFDNRSLEVRKKKNEFETAIKERQNREYELTLSRKLNRVSHQRDAGVRARGYDPITNQNFSGVGAKQLAPSRQVAKPSGWDMALHAARRVQSSNQERHTRTQSAGRRALNSGNVLAATRRTHTGSRKAAAPPTGTPIIPRERKLRSSRPRGQTGRVNVR